MLLVNSPLFRESVAATDEDYLPSLGLGILAQAARNHGAEVDYIDAIFEKRGVVDLTATIERGPYETVGLNIFTVNHHLIREIVEGVRRRVVFVVGGLSTAALLEAISAWRTENTVQVVFGDGEIIFPMLVTNPKSAKPDRSVGSAHFYEINTKSPYYAENISNPLPARDLFENEPYDNIHGLREACIVTSRGCIYNCAFCAAARSMNKGFAVRESSVEGVRADIRSILRNDSSVQSIRVLDDLFLKNRDSIKRAAAIFSEFPVQWRAMAHVTSIKLVTNNDLAALRRSGCMELFIGIESGSPRVLKKIHKPSDTALVRQQMSRMFAAGINAKCYFIFGFPDETEEDMQQTLRLARDLYDDAARNGAKFRSSVFQFRPYHGTELFHDLRSADAAIIDKDARFDRELTDKIGRAQYNFEAGNFSAVATEKLRGFIAEAAALKTPN